MGMITLQLLKKLQIVFIDCNNVLTTSRMYYFDNVIVIQNVCYAKIQKNLRKLFDVK